MIIDGVFPKLTKHKKKAWPKFPFNLDCLALQNSTHATVLGKDFSIMNLGEPPKRMHDPKSYLANLFAHERAKSHYVYEDGPEDSILREVVDF